MNLFSYEENGIIVRPVAADFMELEFEEIEKEDKKENGEEEDFVSNVIFYEEKKEIPLSDEENKELERHLDIVKLRLFLQGKYVFEEGETLAAFDAVDDEREFICTLAYDYMQTAADYMATEMSEEVAVNSVGAGNVAGLQGEPPVNKKKKNMMSFNRFMKK